MFACSVTSNCQATTAADARAQGCGFRPDSGFCGNWFAEFADTGQPLVPSSDCTRDERGGKEMPWCREMVNQTSIGRAGGPHDATR